MTRCKAAAGSRLKGRLLGRASSGDGCRQSAFHDERHVLRGHQTAVVRETAEYVSTWLAERSVAHPLPVRRSRGSSPTCGPGGVRPFSIILPDLDLGRIEVDLTGASIDEPRESKTGR